MSDSEELNRLRADLEVIERYEGRMYALAAAKAEIGNKIDKLEAAADPWREAKQFASAYRDPKGSSHLQKLIAHYDHLTAEVARLTARVAELEAEIKAEDAADVADAESALMKAEFVPFSDMQPPFEGPVKTSVPLKPKPSLQRSVKRVARAIDMAHQRNVPCGIHSLDSKRHRKADEMTKPEDIPNEAVIMAMEVCDSHVSFEHTYLAAIANVLIEAGVVSPPCRVTEKALELAVSELVSDSGIRDSFLSEKTCKAVRDSFIRRAQLTIEREKGQTE